MVPSSAWLRIALIALCANVGYATERDPSSHITQGNVFLESKNYDSAYFHYFQAAQIFASSDNHEGVLQAITGAGKALLRLRRFEDGLDLLTKYEESADAVEAVNEDREAFFDLISNFHYYLGDAFASLKYHQRVYQINEQRGDIPPEKHIDLIRVLAVLYGNSGQLKNAIEYYRQYADLIIQHHGPKHMQLGDAYNYLGIVYRHLGEYDIALDYYSKCLEISEAYTPEERTAISPRFRSIAPVYNNIGSVYHHLGDHDNALAYTLKALKLYEQEKSTSRVSLGAIYGSLGTTYAHLKRHHEALDYKQKALEIYRNEYEPAHSRVASELKNVADSYFDLEDYATAESYYKQALEMNLAVHGKFHINTSESYAKLALIEDLKGNTGQALQNIQESIQGLVKEFGDDNIHSNPRSDAFCHMRTHLISKLDMKGDILMKAFAGTRDPKLLETAHNTYSLAVELSEMVRRALLDIRSKTYLVEHSKKIFEKSIHTALQLYESTGDTKYIAFAFGVMEKNKSRLLLESLLTSKVKSTGAQDNELFNRENGLQNQLAYYEQKILDEQVKPSPDTTKIAVYRQQHFEVRHELESFKAMIEKENPRYYQARYDNTETNLADLQKNLSNNELFIEYFSGNDKLYIFYATREKTGIITETPEVIAHVEELINGIRIRNIKIYEELGNDVFKRILGRVITTTGFKEKITIVPDGILSYLPFEVLLTEPASSKKLKDFDYAIREFSFSYQLSAALMLKKFTRHDDNPTIGFAGFAPQFSGEAVAMRGLPGNIPYAQREINEIASTFPGSVYVGNEATEANFRRHAPDAALLHLATHASLDDNTDFSLLHLASADSTEDGLLHAYEIYNMDLKAKMVTLSACNTGTGKYKEGEGVMSLSRAFAYAGCESTLTSLWPSQDQTTADIMASFYRNLAEGLPKDEALRQAKLDFLAVSDNLKSDPFYWAGFILIGETAPVETGWSLQSILLAIAAIAIVAYLVIRSTRRRRTGSMEVAH